MTLLWIVAFLLYRDVNVWASLDEGPMRGASYTERVYPDSIFRTRANTWSNLAYIYVGLYAIVFAIYDWRKSWPMARGYIPHFPVYSLAFGLACCALGFGSGLFHASLTRLGQHLDVASMYPPMMVLIAAQFGRRLPHLPGTRFPTWPVLLIIVVLVSIYLFIHKWEMSSSDILMTLILSHAAFSILDRIGSGARLPIVGGVFVIFAGVSAYLYASHWEMGNLEVALRLALTLGVLYALLRITPLAELQSRWIILSFLTLVVAVFFRQIDVARKFTGPDAWLQGHFIWHCLTAASQVLLYLYLRSEEREGAES